MISVEEHLHAACEMDCGYVDDSCPTTVDAVERRL